MIKQLNKDPASVTCNECNILLEYDKYADPKLEKIIQDWETYAEWHIICPACSSKVLTNSLKMSLRIHY
jgi:Zn finger protein HypA/HybF involved in hydrogenase expression